MANTVITPTALLNEAGYLFHQKAKFLQSIERQYDDRFAKSGAKIGTALQFRDRNQYNVTDGAVMNIQDTVETYQTLNVTTQRHVAMDFNSADLTMKIDEFSERYIAPAVAKLVSSVENTVITGCYKQVANVIDNDAAAFSYLNVAQAKQRMDEALAPDDGRKLLLCPTHATKYLDASKGFYNPTSKISGQYDSGMVKDFTGFDISATTMLTSHQTGTAVATTGYTVSGASQTGAAITVTGGTTTFLAGDVVTFAGCNAVHPETKANYGYLRQFVILADSGTSATSLSIRPAITVTGAKQNCSASPTDTGAVVKVGVAAVASATMVQSLAYAKPAFIFVSADLEDMSQYGGWGARKQMDSLSLRVWRQGDIRNDTAPVRLDVFFGYLARYPEMACRIHADG